MNKEDLRIKILAHLAIVFEYCVWINAVNNIVEICYDLLNRLLLQRSTRSIPLRISIGPPPTLQIINIVHTQLVSGPTRIHKYVKEYVCIPGYMLFTFKY